MRVQQPIAAASALAHAAVAGAGPGAGALPAGAGAGRMLAWRVHAYGARELRLEEARVPALRDPRDLLVRVHAASINPIDVAMIGGYGARALNALRSLEGAEGVEFPLVPGRDFVGVVERAGAAARARRGQRVWGVLPPHRQGALAHYALVRDTWAGPAPTTLDDASAGGALYAALTACAALRAAGLAGGAGGGGERVLLLGLGGVGQAALQLLVRRGARVTVGCAGDACARAAALGAAAALDRHAPDYDQALEACGPYDAVLDCAGLGGEAAGARRWRFARYVTLTTPLLRDVEARGLALGALSAAAALLAQGARAAAAQRELAAPAPAAPAPRAALPPHVRWAFFSPSAADIERLRRLAERGQFGVFVEDVFPWWRADEAFARAAAGSARGKLVLDFKAEPEPASPASGAPASPAPASPGPASPAPLAE